MNRLQQRLIDMGSNITSRSLIQDLWISQINYPGISITATGTTRYQSETRVRELWDEMIPRNWVEGLLGKS